MKLVWYAALVVIAVLLTGTLYVTNQLSERIDRLESNQAGQLSERIDRLELARRTQVAAFVKGVAVLCGHEALTKELFDFDPRRGADLYTANLSGVILVTQLKQYGLRPDEAFCDNELSQFSTQNGL
ncbi:hypothetical protein [Roseibium sp.]|uniref:hypothetical protein n=1 Tax=Roseibium sp. TaxID=1936156 RepID=UPI003BA8B95B